MNTITRKMRARRDARIFTRALESASPSMQQELLAAHTRSISRAR